jgi:PST family polysaccharide transporter
MNLKQSFGKSTAWMSAAASSNSIISLIIFIVLSRLLTPEEIGLVGFALIVIEIGKIVVYGGFAQAIVRREDWNEAFASTCFYLNILFAAAVALAVFFIVTPLVVHFYDPKAEELLKVLSIIFFLEGAKTVHEGKLRRAFEFRTIAIRTVFSSLCAGTLGIWLAFNGYGVWALVWQQLLSHILIALVTVLSAKWLPGLTFSTVYARELLAFSTPLTLARVTNNASSKVYEVLVGIMIGAAALGFFRVGGRALFILQEIVIKPFEQTLLPTLARLDDRNQQAAATLRVMRICAYFTFPIFFGAAAIGSEFIRFTFTDKWALSGDVMTLLALGIAPMVISYQVSSALTASGNARAVMSISTIVFSLNLTLGLLLVPYGLLAAAGGFALRNYLTIFADLYYFKKVFNVKILHTLKILAPSFCAALLMFASIQGVKLLLPEMPLILQLILCAALGGVVYTLIMTCIFRRETRYFLKESANIAPTKAKPVIAKLQQLLRLA